MHALDLILGSRKLFGWTDICYYGENWKVLRERRLLIWFKDVVEKLLNQWTRKQVMSLWDEMLERVNFLRYIVMHSSKQQEKEEALWKPTYKLHLFP